MVSKTKKVLTLEQQIKRADNKAYNKFKKSGINKGLKANIIKEKWNNLSQEEKCSYADKRLKILPSVCEQNIIVKEVPKKTTNKKVIVKSEEELIKIADNSAYRKFNNQKENINLTSGEVYNKWLNLSDDEKCKFIDKRRKTLPSFCRGFLLKKKGYKKRSVKITSELANEYFFNVSKEVKDLFDGDKYISIKLDYIRKDKRDNYVSQHRFTKTYILDPLNLLRHKFEDPEEAKINMIIIFENRIQKLQREIDYYLTSNNEMRDEYNRINKEIDNKIKNSKKKISRDDVRLSKKDREILNKFDLYRGRISSNNIIINTLKMRLKYINNTQADKINYDQFFKTGDSKNKFRSFNKLDMIIIGGYFYKITEYYYDRNIIITDVNDAEEYYTNENITKITLLDDVEIKYISRSNKLYGFFTKKFTDDEYLKYNFNIDNNNLCSISCLYKNPEFIKYIYNDFIESKDYPEFISFESAKIALNSGFMYGEEVLTFTNIKKVHQTISKLNNKNFKVRYISSKSTLTETYISNDYDEELPIFKVLLHDGHAFNINNKEARKYLNKWVLNEDNYSSLPESKNIFISNQKCWSRLMCDFYLKMMREDCDIIYDNMQFHYIKRDNSLYEESEDKNEILSVKLNDKRNDRIMKSNNKFCESRSDKVNHNLLYKSSSPAYYDMYDLTEYDKDEMQDTDTKKYLHQYTQYTNISMDLETYNDPETDIIKIYSLSYCYFDDEKILGEPEFLYSNNNELDIICISNELDKIISMCEGQLNFRIFFHNGAKFDMKILETLFCKIPGLIVTNCLNNNGIINFSFIYNKASFDIKDSCRILNCPVSGLSKMYRLDNKLTKFKYPYALYQEIKSKGLNDIMSYNEVVELLKSMKDNIEYRYKDIKVCNDWLKDYKLETYCFKDICKEYNDQDVIIVAEALIKARKMYIKLGERSNLISLKEKAVQLSHYVYKKNKPTLKVFRVLNNSMTEYLTISSLARNMVMKEGILDNEPRCHTNNLTYDYLKPFVRGGICHPSHVKSNRLFISSHIEDIVKHPNFYIKPEDKEIANYLVKFGYDINKDKNCNFDNYNEVIKYLFDKKGSLVCLDFNSLYPSIMYMFDMPSGKYSKMTIEEFNGYNFKDRKYRFFAYFNVHIGDTISNIKYLSYTNSDGEKIKIEENKKYVLAMNDIDFEMFLQLYPDSEYEFKHGIRSETLTKKLSKLVKKLYDERVLYKKLSNHEDEKMRDMSSLESIIKLILNSMYGSFIQSEHLTYYKYLSKSKSYRAKKMAEKKCSEILDSEEFNKWIKDNDRQDYYEIIDHTDIIKIVSEYLIDINACESDYDIYLKNKINKVVNIIDIENSKNISSICEFRNDTREHFNKMDWGSIILSGSKYLMHELIKNIGEDNVYYIDTDSVKCESRFTTVSQVMKGFGDDLGKFKSDYDGTLYNEPVGNGKYNTLSEICNINGLCSIISITCGKKLYCDMILGLHPEGYMTCKLKKRAKGMSGNNIPIQEFENMLKNGSIYEQDTLDYYNFKTVSRNHELKNVKNGLKHIKADITI